MSAPSASALYPWVPARKLERSQRFYQALGFHAEALARDAVLMRLGSVGFVLHGDYMAVVAMNTRMSLQVVDVAGWWQHVQGLHLADVYGIEVGALTTRADGRQGFDLLDPSGVSWRIEAADSVGA
jgi:hypothetical protein